MNKWIPKDSNYRFTDYAPEITGVAGSIMSRNEKNNHFTSLKKICIPEDITPEEIGFLEIVKERMMQRLGDDRCRLIFVMIFELGKSQIETARAMGVHETEISRQMENIRARLHPFRKGYSKL